MPKDERDEIVGVKLPRYVVENLAKQWAGSNTLREACRKALRPKLDEFALQWLREMCRIHGENTLATNLLDWIEWARTELNEGEG